MLRLSTKPRPGNRLLDVEAWWSQVTLSERLNKGQNEMGL